LGGQRKLTGKYEKQALTMLKRVCDFLDQVQIKYLLEAGTLLGIIRENRLLPWDTDLDITVSAEFLEPLLQNRWKLWLHGYRTRIRYFKRDMGPFKKNQVRLIRVQTTHFFFFKDSSLMDIFIKYKRGDYYEWVVSERDPILKRAPAHFYDELKRIPFHGSSYCVPKDSEGYLAYHYGNDWKTPVKTWDYKYGDFCDKQEL